MMNNQELYIHTHTGSDGVVHLAIPTQFINQELELKVTFAAPASAISEDEELAEILTHAKPASNLIEYSGSINLSEDPLAFQQNIRREW